MFCFWGAFGALLGRFWGAFGALLGPFMVGLIVALSLVLWACDAVRHQKKEGERERGGGVEGYIGSGGSVLVLFPSTSRV